MKEGRVIALLGPTGVGKTAVAVEVAGLLDCRIISCDSMQVYSGFPVLTNQPRHDEDRPDLHEMVGFLDPADTISAGDFARRVEPLVRDSVAECGWALLAGGSGLYMRAALAPLAATGPADRELRQELEERARAKGPEVLYEELARLDPEAANDIDRRNVRRVVRALEGLIGGGSRWSGRDDLWQPEYHRSTIVVGLSLERDLLAERIRVRTATMLSEGAIEEVRRFRMERDDGVTRPGQTGICSAIGYGAIVEHLDDGLSLERVQERMSAATRRYARRQGTWLRRVRDAVMIGVQGCDARAVAEDIVATASARFDGQGARTR